MPILHRTPQYGPGSQPYGNGDREGGFSIQDFLQRGSRYSLPGFLANAFSPTQTGFQPGRNISEEFSRLPSGRAGSALNQQRPPSLSDILARLESLQDPNRYMPNMDLLEMQARSGANAQYDPIISRLRNQMGLAETRAGRNKEALGAMFNQLSGNLAGEIPGIQQMYDQTEQQTAQRYAGLQQSIQGQYAKSQAEQEAMMQRLNIEAAAPDALQQQGIDRDFFVNQAGVNSQVQQDALGQEERGAVEYTRKGSQMAQTEGTQRQADLMFQLQDLLAQYEGQIGEAETAKNQSYLSSLAGLQGDAQNDAISRAQRDFENYIKVLNLGQSLSKSGQGALTVQSPADVSGRVMNLGVDANSAQAIQNVFMSAISSDPMIQAGIDSNFGQALPKEALAARIVEAGRNAGLNSAALNALQIAALEYFGRR